MTPSEYLAILLDMIERKIITLDEAAELMQRFQTGDFDEASLPLPIAEATSQDNSDEWLLLFLAFSLGNRRTSLRQRRRNLATIRQRFEQRTADNTERMSNGALSVRQWHQEQQQTLGGAMLAAWLAGNGTDTQPAINEQMQEQLSYLYRFAAESHIRQAVGRPQSEGSLLNRALMYAGAIRGAFFRGNESPESGWGWVSHYLPIDDQRTCGPCRRAGGYYLPGSGPYPGERCLGGWKCRCSRVMVYSPEIYAQLTGVAIPI